MICTLRSQRRKAHSELAFWKPSPLHNHAAVCRLVCHEGFLAAGHLQSSSIQRQTEPRSAAWEHLERRTTHPSGWRHRPRRAPPWPAQCGLPCPHGTPSLQCAADCCVSKWQLCSWAQTPLPKTVTWGYGSKPQLSRALRTTGAWRHSPLTPPAQFANRLCGSVKVAHQWRRGWGPGTANPGAPRCRSGTRRRCAAVPAPTPPPPPVVRIWWMYSNDLPRQQRICECIMRNMYVAGPGQGQGWAATATAGLFLIACLHSKEGPASSCKMSIHGKQTTI